MTSLWGFPHLIPAVAFKDASAMKSLREMLRYGCPEESEGTMSYIYAAENLKVQSEDIMRRYEVLCFFSSNCDSSSADRCKFSWPPGDPVDQSEDPNQRARRWPISRRYMEAGAEFFSQ
jgi:hypothetical protein